VNRGWLNGLCVTARVCLLYMLFDPDMISWRERGPGQASLRTLLHGLTQPPPPSLGRRPQLPSAPVWAASPGQGSAGGHEAGVRRGDRQLGWEDAAPHTHT
jgi:hypothetical protein